MSTVSSYRHIYSEPSKPENNYSEVNILSTTVDTNLLAANYRFAAVPWETRGGGVFTVLDITGNGKIGQSAPLFTGHTAAVIDVAFDPFNDYIVASAADDATIRIWNIDASDGKVKPNAEAGAVLKGHGRRVGRIVFNPLVENCLASFGAENSVKLWDITKGQAVSTFKAAKDNLLDLNWSQDGNFLVYPAKDKMLHLLDVRANNEVFQIKNHPGLRGGRALFYDKLNYVITTGFSQTSARQISVRDKRNPENPLSTVDVDFNTGVLAPFIDEDNGVLYTFSRGDTAVKYYELRSDGTPLMELSAFACPDSLRAFAHAPKYCVDTAKCEVDRFYTVTQGKQLITMPFIVPRRNAEIFQDDLYPPTNAPEPAIGFDAWKAGGNAEPKKINLAEPFKPSEPSGSKISVPIEETEDATALRAEIVQLKAHIAELEAQVAQLKGSK